MPASPVLGMTLLYGIFHFDGWRLFRQTEGAPMGRPGLLLAAAAVVVAAAVVAAVVAVVAAAVTAAAVAQQENNDDPPAAVTTKAIVVPHNNYLRKFIVAAEPLIPRYSGSQKMCCGKLLRHSAGSGCASSHSMY